MFLKTKLMWWKWIIIMMTKICNKTKMSLIQTNKKFKSLSSFLCHFVHTVCIISFWTPETLVLQILTKVSLFSIYTFLHVECFSYYLLQFGSSFFLVLISNFFKNITQNIFWVRAMIISKFGNSEKTFETFEKRKQFFLCIQV